MSKQERNAFEDVKSHWANKKLKANPPETVSYTENPENDTQRVKNISKPTIIELSSDDDDDDDDDNDDNDGAGCTIVGSSQTRKPPIDTTQRSQTHIQNMVYPRMYLLYSPLYDPLSCINNANKAVNPFYITEQSMFSTLATELQSDKLYHRETLFLWSFQFDFEALIPHLELHNTRVSRVIYVFHQQGTVLPPEDPVLLEVFEDLVRKRLLVFRQHQMPAYSSFHCKMILKVNHQLNKCKIIIPSSNFTKLEPKYVQQMVFDSGMMALETDTNERDLPNESSHNFKNNFIQFLKIFDEKFKNDHVISEILRIMNCKADFTFLNEKYDFVFSSSKNEQTGLQLLKKTICAKTRDCKTSLINTPKTKFIVQTSSIGAPLSQYGDSTLLETSFPQCLPILLNQKTKYEIVFPTSQSILNSPLGLLTSGWFHFHHKRSSKIASMYRRWKQSRMLFTHSHGYRTGNSSHSDATVSSTTRQYVPSHTKFYIVEDLDDIETFKENNSNKNTGKTVQMWMFTTANLSKAAWGVYHLKPVNGIHKFTPPTNFECGVLRVCKEKNSKNKITLRNIIEHQQRWNNTPEVDKPAFRNFKKEYEDGVVYCIFDPSKLVPYDDTDIAFCPEESS
ncbi:hypothetical protein ACO0RG_003298 [Hanseniaspora osmophila]